MTKEIKPTVNWGANNVAFCNTHNKYGVCHKCNAEAKKKRLHRLLWSAGNCVMPQHLLDEITKLRKELASNSNPDTLLPQ